MPTWAISRTYVLSWGTHGHSAIRLPVHDLDEFRRGYDLANADAEISGGLFEVDLWDTAFPLDRPIVVRFLVGHATRSRVLVHSDGPAHYAVGDESPDYREGLRYERPGGFLIAEPETVTITPNQAQEVLADFVRTGRASGRVRWVEL